MQFVDLLSTTNVSVYYFAEERYGWYMHGRSVFSRADVDVSVLEDYLECEKSEAVAKRGLTGNNDVIFEMFASPALSSSILSVTAYTERSAYSGDKRKFSTIKMATPSAVIQNSAPMSPTLDNPSASAVRKEGIGARDPRKGDLLKELLTRLIDHVRELNSFHVLEFASYMHY
jgi:hypothetical protein